MGPHHWDTPTNVCGDDKSERELFLTSCNETEFSCLDGVCIPIQERYYNMIFPKMNFKLQVRWRSNVS